MFDLSIVKRVLPVIRYVPKAVPEALAPTKPLNLRKLRGAAPLAAVEASTDEKETCEPGCPGTEAGQAPAFTATLSSP